jgi:hypothetical protein
MGIFHPLDPEYPPYVIPQIGQVSKQFRMMLCIEPNEVLIIALDEHCRPRYSSVSLKPRPKIAPAAITARRLIDPAGIGPDRDISDVEH